MADDIRKVYEGIQSGGVRFVREMLTLHPEFGDANGDFSTWLHQAAGTGNIEMVEMLIGLGYDVNHYKQAGTPLARAIGDCQLEMARYLITRGADPNLDRTLISAINLESEELGLEFVKLLVERGTDINRVFPWFGNQDLTFTPLEWAIANGKTRIADYLRSKRAVEREPKPGTEASQPKNLAEEVVAYFEEQFGPVQLKALIEIVPAGLPIAIHVIPPGEDRNHVTLFTTGMSEQAMIVPESHTAYRFAELFIQLPAPWPLTKEALSDPNQSWPIHWLRSTARYPHENGTWLGGPVTIIANDDPPKPLAPNVKFTSVLLIAEKDFVSQARGPIQLYRLIPLYTEERNLEIKEAIAALMRAFDQGNVSAIVDLERPSVVGVS
jgi:uncharacterized protein